MVRLYSVTILHKGDSVVKVLKSASDLSSFNFFQRKSVGEFLNFATNFVAERTQPGQRQSVKQQDYMCHVFVRHDGITGVLVADQEYPSRVAFTVLSKVTNEFVAAVPKEKWDNSAITPIVFEGLEALLQKYQNPKEADAMTKVQTELDETKVILHETMESLMQRGENLDNLVTKSDQLSDQSKQFYKQAKKMNSWCCVIQ